MGVAKSSRHTFRFQGAGDGAFVVLVSGKLAGQSVALFLQLRDEFASVRKTLR